MPLGGPGYVRCLAAARADGTNRVSFTTAITTLPEHARTAMDAADWYEGRTLRITFAGRISNIATNQPTFTFEVRLGPTANLAVFSTGALLTSTTAHVTVPLWGEILLTVRALGATTTANLMGQATLTSRALIDSGATADLVTSGHPSLLGPESNPAVGSGFDSTIQNVLDLFVACSVNSASNAFQLTQFILEDLGV